MELVTLARRLNRAWLIATPLAVAASLAEPSVYTPDAAVGGLGMMMLQWVSLLVLGDPSQFRLRAGAAVVNAGFGLWFGLPVTWQVVVVPGSEMAPAVAVVVLALATSMLITALAIVRLPKVRPFS